MDRQRPVAPVRFVVERVLDDDDACFVRQVGLVPLAGRVATADVAAATLAVVERWRRRVRELAEWRVVPAWSPAVAPDDPGPRSQKWRMLDCAPAFACCAPATPPCGVRTLCPFCWSRTMLRPWHAIDAALFGAAAAAGDAVSIADAAAGGGRPRAFEFAAAPAATTAAVPRRADLAMIVRSITYTLPERTGGLNPASLVRYRLLAAPPGGGRRRRDRLPGRAAELARFRRAGVLGGLDTTHVAALRPRRRGGPSPGSAVTFRQVLFCAAGCADEVTGNPAVAAGPAAGAAGTPTPVLAVALAPSRAAVLAAVARSCRYPRVLVHGDYRGVVAALAVRGDGHRRLLTTFGILYGSGHTPGG